MAIVNPSLDNDLAKGVRRTVWTLTGMDSGFPQTAPQYPNRSVHVVGTFGGGTILIEGSNDGGVTWFGLNDPQGLALSFTVTATGEKVAETTQMIRPRASVSVTSVAIHLLSQSGRN